MPEETTTSDASAQTGTQTSDNVATTTTNPELGEAGKKALDEERSARRKAEKEARDAQSELDRLRQQSMTEQEKAVAAARAEGKAEAFKDATSRLVRAEVRAAAGGKLADPSDAIGLLDLDSFVDDKGEIDSKAITSAIDRLVSDKPYLSARPGNGSGEGGPRGAASASTSDPLADALAQISGASRT